jgi:hypothetical protein
VLLLQPLSDPATPISPALLPPPSQDTLPATTYRPYRPYRQADTDFFLKYLMLQIQSPTCGRRPLLSPPLAVTLKKAVKLEDLQFTAASKQFTAASKQFTAASESMPSSGSANGVDAIYGTSSVLQLRSRCSLELADPASLMCSYTRDPHMRPKAAPLPFPDVLPVGMQLQAVSCRYES